MFKLHYEVWKPVVGCEGKYEVSNYCSVKSLIFNNTHKEKILKSRINHCGYVTVSLRFGGKSYNKFAHRIGMTAFVDNPDFLKEVNHKDENKTNNFIYVNGDGTVNKEKSNLEWCSRGYNLEYSQVNQRNGKKRSRKVKQILNGVVIHIYESINEAGRICKLDCGSIVKCCKKYDRYKTCGGYEWEYE